MWDTTNIGEDEWYSSGWDGDAETLESFVPFQEAPWMPETHEELCHVTYDHEGHVICCEHEISQPAQDCP